MPFTASAAHSESSASASGNVPDGYEEATLSQAEIEKYIDEEYVNYSFSTAAEMLNYELQKGYLYYANSAGKTHTLFVNKYTGFVYYVQVKEVPAGVLTVEQTKTVTDLILNGEKAVYPSNVDSRTRRNIYLSSVNYIYIRYTVEFFSTEDGEMYLQDPASGKCVKATAELSDIFSAS
jgi:hypothetical protein